MLGHKFQLTVVQVNRLAASVLELIMLSISRSRRASIPAADLAASTRLSLDPVGYTKCQQDHRYQEGWRMAAAVCLADPMYIHSQLELISYTFAIAGSKEMFEVLLSCTDLLVSSCHSRKGSWSLWLQNHYWTIQLPAVISWCCGPDPKPAAVSDQSPRVNHAPSVLVGWLFVCAKCWVNV